MGRTLWNAMSSQKALQLSLARPSQLAKGGGGLVLQLRLPIRMMQTVEDENEHPMSQEDVRQQQRTRGGERKGEFSWTRKRGNLTRHPGHQCKRSLIILLSVHRGLFPQSQSREAEASPTNVLIVGNASG